MEKLRKNQASILFWIGFALITAGVYLWLRAAGALIFAGIWLSALGIMMDLVQGKRLKEPEK